MNTVKKTHTEGFTLIEAMIVMTIIGILAGISGMSVMRALPNYRLKGAASELLSYMQKAKAEAIKRNTNVGIDFSTVGYPDTGGKYTGFIDDGTGGGTAGDGDRDANEPILFEVEMPKDATLCQASFGTGADGSTGYNYKGLPLANRSGSVILRNNQSRWYRLSLSSSGHPKMEKSGDGINWYNK